MIQTHITVVIVNTYYKLHNMMAVTSNYNIYYKIHNTQYTCYYRDQTFRTRVGAMTSVVRRSLGNGRATSLICNIIVLYSIARHVILLLFVLLTQ